MYNPMRGNLGRWIMTIGFALGLLVLPWPRPVWAAVEGCYLMEDGTSYYLMENGVDRYLLEGGGECGAGPPPATHPGWMGSLGWF